MAILNATNKRKGKFAIFIFGLVVLVTMLVRIFRTKVDKPADYVSLAKDELKNLTSLNTVLMLLGAAGSIALLAYEYVTGAGAGEMAVLLGVLTTGDTVVSTFNTTYLPKFVHYVSATQLKGMKITVQGDGVVWDADTAGLTSAGVLRQFGQVTNGYTIQVANGLITGKNVIWEFTNGAAATPSIYVSADQTPARGKEAYLQMLRQAVLANSGQNFTDFATLALPSLGATDIVNILYADGTQQQFNRAELQAYLVFTQNINASLYTIDNFDGRIKMVNVLAGAAQTAYVQRWVSAAAGRMINQSVNN